MTNSNSFSQLEFSLLNSHQLSISLLTNRQQRKWRGRKGMTTITGWESEREMRKISGKNKPNTLQKSCFVLLLTMERCWETFQILRLFCYFNIWEVFLILFLMNANVIYLRMSSDLAGGKDIHTSSLVLNYSLFVPVI